MSTTANSSSSMSTKRKRDPTFSSSEKELLLQLVEANFSIVESKKTDALSMKNKAKEWRKIAVEFNAESAIYPRNYNVLKNCWENMKKRAKQEQTSRNQHDLRTGGDPPKKEPEDPLVNKVLELIQTRVSASGSTAADTQKAEQDTDIENSEPLQEVFVYENWSEYKPSMLKMSKKSALTNMSPQEPQECRTINISTPKRVRPERQPSTSTSSLRPPNQKTDTLTSERINTLKKTNNHADEEHELKMSILKTQLQNEQELLTQAMLKTRQEEIKLEILELQFKKIKD